MLWNRNAHCEVYVQTVEGGRACVRVKDLNTGDVQRHYFPSLPAARRALEDIERPDTPGLDMFLWFIIVCAIVAGLWSLASVPVSTIILLMYLSGR